MSALIHAATMVTAGVYLVARAHPLFLAGPIAADVVAWVGAITALMAASAALVINDIKRVLAYSTISQLGYMFLALGVGAYGAAVFHMITNAFFKALLFLGAGSVMHSLHDELDMRRMGGLRRYLPVTTGTFIVAWLAIAGIFPFAGFWSKDAILARAFEQNRVGALGGRSARRLPDRVLHGPAGVPGGLRERAEARPSDGASREPGCHDRADDRPCGPDRPGWGAQPAVPVGGVVESLAGAGVRGCTRAGRRVVRGRSGPRRCRPGGQRG